MIVLARFQSAALYISVRYFKEAFLLSQYDIFRGLCSRPISRANMFNYNQKVDFP